MSEKTKTVTIRISEKLYNKLTKNGKEKISPVIEEFCRLKMEYEAELKEEIKGMFTVKEWCFLQEFFYFHEESLRNKHDFWQTLQTHGWSMAEGENSPYADIDVQKFINEKILPLKETQVTAIANIISEYREFLYYGGDESNMNKWFEYYAKEV
jgi:predicted CopG family antitoxin